MNGLTKNVVLFINTPGT